MIELKCGDILKDESEALVNTVNCVGVMGRGIALQFKKAYPENFKAYATACQGGEVQPGRMFVFEIGQLTAPRYVINFPTKRHWRGKSRIEDIEAGSRRWLHSSKRSVFVQSLFRRWAAASADWIGQTSRLVSKGFLVHFPMCMSPSTSPKGRPLLT
jgi:O-acetyl-ADP-ribose deacetylase (regulator of RNase III)